MVQLSNTVRMESERMRSVSVWIQQTFTFYLYAVISPKFSIRVFERLNVAQ